MLEDMLVMTTVSVTKETLTPDDMGGFSVSSTTTTLPKAVIYQNTAGRSVFSGRINLVGSHTLVTVPSYYAWSANDRKVSYDGNEFTIAGIPENIMGLDEITIVPLELVK